MQQMSAQSSPNFGRLEYEGMNDKSVVCWKLSENKVIKLCRLVEGCSEEEPPHIKDLPGWNGSCGL